MVEATAPLEVNDQNQLLVASDDIGDNQMWNHRGSVEVTYDDLRQITAPSDTDTYTSIGHSDFAETLYKHADRLMAPKGYTLDGQKYIVSKEGNRMFFIHSYTNGDTQMNLALAGRNSYDKSMRAALAVAAKVTVCDNLCMITEDGVSIFRKHSGDARSYLNDQIILGMVKATDSWDDMRYDRDSMVELPIGEREGFELMGYTKAMTRSDKSASKRLLTTPKEWNAVQNYWEAPKHEYEGGNRTLWSWYNSFTVDMKDLKPELQLAQHASIHSIVKGEVIERKIETDYETEESDAAQFRNKIDELISR